jgi:fructose-1,6-bisphosphatase/inositol monophosphatase family enzyme
VRREEGLLQSPNDHQDLPKHPQKWVDILRKAAEAGKQAIEKNYDPKSRATVVKRGVGGDWTLKIDEASESAIHESLLQDLGADSFVFVSEEIGEIKSRGKETKPIIFCDPLDGSHNALVGVPLFSISLAVLGLKRGMALTDRRSLGDVDVGLIINVPSGDEFYAIKNQGSFHNRSQLRGPDLPAPDPRFQTLGVECGDVDYLKVVMKNLSSKTVYKLRVLGSAAISYCMLADGTFDGFIFVQPNGARTIDSPAGYLIAKEAKRLFSDLNGKMKSLDRVKLGFDSRINIVGAKDRKTLSRLVRVLNM